MADTYRISSWSETFETADSRKHKSLSWVSLPIDRQSNGYQSMIDHFGDDAPSVYGAWCVLISIAAGCPVRGVLASSRGNAFSISRIARMAHMPQEVFERLIPWALRKEVGWLEIDSHDGESSTGCESIANQSAIELPNTTQHNTTQPNQSPSDSVDEIADGESSLPVGISEKANPPKPSVKPEEVFAAWNKSRSVKKANSLTKERRKKLRTRLADPNWPWRAAIAALPVANDDRFDWQPDIDWLIRNETNAFKLAEGSYSNRAGPQRGSRGPLRPADETPDFEATQKIIKDRQERRARIAAEQGVNHVG